MEQLQGQYVQHCTRKRAHVHSRTQARAHTQTARRLEKAGVQRCKVRAVSRRQRTPDSASKRHKVHRRRGIKRQASVQMEDPDSDEGRPRTQQDTRRQRAKRKRRGLLELPDPEPDLGRAEEGRAKVQPATQEQFCTCKNSQELPKAWPESAFHERPLRGHWQTHTCTDARRVPVTATVPFGDSPLAAP